MRYSLYRSLTSKPKRSNWPLWNPTSNRMLSSLTSPRPSLDTPSITTPIRMPSSSSIPVRPVRRSRSVCFLPVPGTMPSTLLPSRGSRSLRRYVIVVSRGSCFVSGLTCDRSRHLPRMRSPESDCTKKSIRPRTKDPSVDLPDLSGLAGKGVVP